MFKIPCFTDHTLKTRRVCLFLSCLLSHQKAVKDLAQVCGKVPTASLLEL